MPDGPFAMPIVVHGGRVFTSDVDSPWADAVVVDGERIAYVGSKEGALKAAGDGAEVVDLEGGILLPGLVGLLNRVSWLSANCFMGSTHLLHRASASSMPTRIS